MGIYPSFLGLRSAPALLQTQDKRRFSPRELVASSTAIAAPPQPVWLRARERWGGKERKHTRACLQKLAGKAVRNGSFSLLKSATKLVRYRAAKITSAKT